MHALKRVPIGIAAGMVRRVDEVPLELAEMIDHITFGSFTLHEREGNTGMTYHFDHATGTSYNAINLKNLGLLWFLVNELPKVVPLRERGCKIRVSLAPLTPEELVEMILMIMRFEHLVHLV